tara:strand:+ start:373 stop:684 length:312 start_codon:yes stop_codon:yes gene_type:complete
MGRYDNTTKKKNKIGQRVYGVTLYPKIPIQDGDQFYYPIDGERVDSVAQKFYGDQTLWWIIAEANVLKDGGFALDPNKELRIPKNIAPILQEFRSINEEFLNR